MRRPTAAAPAPTVGRIGPPDADTGLVSDRGTSYIRPFMFDRARLDPDWWEDRAPARAGLPTEYHDDDPRVVGADLGLLPEARSLDDPPQQEDFAALISALRQVQDSAAHVRLGFDRRGRRA